MNGISKKEIEDIVYHALAKFYQNVILVRMPTKEDLEVFATKEDLERFATKEDLEEVKEDIRRMDGKLDLVAGKVTITESNHERRIRRIETKLKLPAIAN